MFRQRGRLCWAVAGLGVAIAGVAFWCGPVTVSATPADVPPAEPAEASEAQVRQFCGTACHAYPPPDSFPRSAWRDKIKQAYGFFQASRLQTDFPSLEGVARYYERRAPERLPSADEPAPPAGPGVSFRRTGYRADSQGPHPAVTNVSLGHLFGKHKLDVVVCDARAGQVLAFQPYTQPPRWRVLGTMPAPDHAEVVDLDGDGIPDVLVACLGRFPGTDDRVGSVVWLRGKADGTFTPHTLLKDVGRVADVQAADFRGTGKLDLVVADFGWQEVGEVLYLENRTTDWARPEFVPRVLDPRTGAVNVAVGDLDGDGRPDVVALLSQEHETVVAFLNDGRGGFKKEAVYTGPHPAYGSSGIQLVDMDGDGKLDVLYTNGDILDPPYILKPYHSIQWLRNRGQFPFEHHHLAAMPGASRAVAADLRGVGRKDVVAVNFLPPEMFPQRKELGLSSVILLEQSAPGRFDRHVLETVTCDHFTCALGDLDGSGSIDLVTGNFCWGTKYESPEAVTIWKNVGAKKGPGP